jgi:hypothetical protein
MGKGLFGIKTGAYRWNDKKGKHELRITGEAYFNPIALSKACDYIRLRDGKHQIWIILQELKDIPEPNEKGGRYHSHKDISNYTNIYLDVDAVRPDGFKDYAATVEERARARDQLPAIEKWLSEKGFGRGLELFTGNGCGIVLPIPPTPAMPEFVAKVTAFLKVAKEATGCDIDTSMFDPGRIIGIPGTINVKLETEGRKNRRREIIGPVPERFEDQALLDFILSLDPDPEALREWAKKYDEPVSDRSSRADKTDDSEGILDRLATILETDPKLKNLLGPHNKRYKTRSEQEFAACGKLIEHGFTDSEISFIMCHVSKIGKWVEEGDHYRFDQTLRKLREAEGNGGAGEGEQGWEKGGKISEEIKTELRADKQKILDPAFLHKLLRLSPLEREALIGEIKEEGLLLRGVRTSTIYNQIEKLSATLQSPKHDEGVKVDIDPGVKEKALAIATRGDSLKYLVWQGQRNHLGDISYQKVLIGSIASSASLTSNGIQPGGTGDKGSGKSDACVAVYHLVPEDRRLDGSLSPMSLFYLQEKGLLQAGMVLFSDDVEYEGITPIYKRSTARFQHGITHFTVSSGKNREALELKIPPRMVWWLTSVESVANEQAFDRQYPISTDSSLGHKTRVAKEIAARRARKELRLAVDEGILIARAIFADIFDNGSFQVVIPQADKAEWIKVADFRGQEQFWDLVDALTILRWRQR